MLYNLPLQGQPPEEVEEGEGVTSVRGRAGPLIKNVPFL